jgi:hypothetical protein
MAKKLQNIRAINQMLSGTHKSQNKTTVGYQSKEEDRNVGDKWIDNNGVQWEQKDGYKVSSAKALEAVMAAIKALKMPNTCPKCNNEMKDNQYNKKMWKVHKMCFDCVIDMEHDHRLNGTYEQYEKDLMRKNIEAWLIDARAEMGAIKELLTKAEFVNSDGTVEKWDSPWKGKEQELEELLEKDFQKVKSQLLGEPINEIINT